MDDQVDAASGAVDATAPIVTSHRARLSGVAAPTRHPWRPLRSQRGLPTTLANRRGALRGAHNRAL